jgi:tetratricopeptide (TPR) repeat protein
MHNVLSRAFFSYFITGATFLLPLFFVPYLANLLVNSKLLILFAIALVVAAAAIVNFYKTHSFTIPKNQLFWPTAGFALAVLTATFFNYTYQSKQFMGMGGAYLSFSLIVLFLPHLHTHLAASRLRSALNAATLVIALSSLAAAFNYGPAIIINAISGLELPSSLDFSLTGSILANIQLLSVVIIANLANLSYLRQSWLAKSTVVLGLIALGLNIWTILPGKTTTLQLLPLNTSVAIVRSSLSLTKNALIGTGPDGYGNAYNLLKPNWVNGTPYWQFTFESAINVPLTIVVSLGLLGLASYLWLSWRALVITKQSWLSAMQQPTANPHLFWSAIVALALLWHWFTPTNVMMLAILAIALSLLVSQTQANSSFLLMRLPTLVGKWHQRFTNSRSYLFHALLFALTGLGIWVTVITSRNFLAYYFLQRGNMQLAQSNITGAYEAYQQAKNYAPRIDFVRRNFSTINMQIAIALSNKTDLQPAEQDQVLKLINQAIREAKAASILDPYNYLNWLTLGQIYSQLTDSTQQAEQEAFNALAKAATYNPNNPEVRIALGQLFLQTNRLTNAVIFFGQAIERKPDMFLAHYLMAQALRAQRDYQSARDYLLSSVELLDLHSEDYKRINQEIQELEQLIETGEENSTSTASATLDESDDAEVLTTDLGQVLQSSAEAIIQEGALSSEEALVGN